MNVGFENSCTWIFSHGSKYIIVENVSYNTLKLSLERLSKDMTFMAYAEFEKITMNVEFENSCTYKFCQI